MNIKYKKIIIVAGARPNFVKVSPLLKAFKALPKAKRPGILLLHTGQHYDYLMSKVFFEDLNIPKPDIFLNVKARTTAGQTDEIITKFQKVLAVQKPDLVIVVGDVTGTMACALAAKLSGNPVAHVEAGLRSYDQTMPEELNRVLTDHISDLLFTSCPEALGNLLKEGIPKTKIHFAGNVMIDTLKTEIPKIKNKRCLNKLGLVKGDRIQPYVILTLHRPSNVDDPKVLGPIVKAFEQIAEETTVIFPAHPRTLERLKTKTNGSPSTVRHCSPQAPLRVKNGKSEIGNSKNRLKIVLPLGYLDFIALQQHAVCVFTDSGGVQEETSFLKVPCFTVRPNTERPVTVELGTNKVIGTKPGAILKAWGKFKSVQPTAYSRQRKTSIPRWDGHAAERIVKTIVNEQ